MRRLEYTQHFLQSRATHEPGFTGQSFPGASQPGSDEPLAIVDKLDQASLDEPGDLPSPVEDPGCFS